MSKLPIIVVGGGGHAKVLIETLLYQQREIIGIVDGDVSKIGTTVLGVPVIGGDEIVFKYSIKEICLINALGSVKDTKLRQYIYEKFKQRGYWFEQVIHKSAIIASDVQLDEGVQIMAGAIIQTGTSIGSNSIINTGAVIDHDCRIGNHVHIAPGSVLSGGVEIGTGTHIGTGSVIIQSITIGSNSTIGAGSVVITHMIDGITALGVPAKIINKTSIEK